jgi:hypothetical protein
LLALCVAKLRSNPRQKCRLGLDKRRSSEKMKAQQEAVSPGWTLGPRSGARMLVGDLVDTFLSWCGRHRSPATVRFYGTRLRLFRTAFASRDVASLSSLEIDAYLHDAGLNVSNSTRHHNAVSLTTLQSFACASP